MGLKRRRKHVKEEAEKVCEGAGRRQEIRDVFKEKELNDQRVLIESLSALGGLPC